MREKNAILELRNLTAGYGTGKDAKIVLKNVNLKLDPGNLVCFMGPNGVGKSTLLRTIAGIQKPLKGEILLLGKSVKSFTKNQLARSISLVLTEKVSAGNLSVLDLVALGRYPYTNWFMNISAVDQEKINEAVVNTKINPILDQKIYELSDGQLQKSMIARALAQDGELMILDEPNSHLDLNNRVEIMSLLRDLTRKTGKTILMATHELDLALQTADIIWLAGDEDTIITGIPEDLILNGDFDKIFQMKGYDLKTGKIQLKNEKNEKIKLLGKGYSFLWTKNALERNGFAIITDGYSDKIVEVKASENYFLWNLIINEGSYNCKSIEELLDKLK